MNECSGKTTEQKTTVEQGCAGGGSAGAGSGGSTGRVLRRRSIRALIALALSEDQADRALEELRSQLTNATRPHAIAIFRQWLLDSGLPLNREQVEALVRKHVEQL